MEERDAIWFLWVLGWGLSRFSVICFVEYAENVLLSRFCDCNVWGVVDCARDGINNSTRCR